MTNRIVRCGVEASAAPRRRYGSLDREWHDLCRDLVKCRACGPPCGYRPKPLVPPPAYRRGGICFVQINPGHIGNLTATEIDWRYRSDRGRSTARAKMRAAKRLQQARDRYIAGGPGTALQAYRDELIHQMREDWGWPPGKYGKTLEAHGVTLDQVAVINLAQCPVPNDGYRKQHLKTCWQHWTSRLLECLEPGIVVAQGRQVFQFLSSHELPIAYRLVEGIHHASRAPRLSKDAALARVSDIICSVTDA